MVLIRGSKDTANSWKIQHCDAFFTWLTACGTSHWKKWPPVERAAGKWPALNYINCKSGTDWTVQALMNTFFCEKRLKNADDWHYFFAGFYACVFLSTFVDKQILNTVALHVQKIIF